MPEVLYHPGWPKTATKSLQFGIERYPNLAAHPWNRGTAGKYCHGVLDQLCYGSAWNPGILESLLEVAQVDPDTSVFLSDERIIGGPVSRHPLGHVGEDETLRRIAPPAGWRATVLLTLRNPRALLHSTYLHEVRMGSPRTYDQFLQAILDERVDGSGPFAIRRIIDDYAQAFGQENVCVAFMEDFVSDPVEFWRAVSSRLQLTGYTEATATVAPSKNRTHLGPSTLELFLNRHVLRSAYAPHRKNLPRALSRKRWNWIDQLLKRSAGPSYFAHTGDREAQLCADLGVDVTEVALAAGVAPERVAAIVDKK
jgi:hypothetical protein